MTSILSGIAKTLSSGGDNAEPKRSAHAAFVEAQLIPAVQRLQRELGWRRHKECQAPLQEAVLQLRSFQREPWPPTREAAAAAKNENGSSLHHATTITIAAAAPLPSSSGDDARTVDTEGSSTAPTTADSSSTREEEEDASSSEEATTAAGGEEPDSKPSAALKALDEAVDRSNHSQTQQQPQQQSATTTIAIAAGDDPQTREPVHPAVIATLRACMQVLASLSSPGSRRPPQATEASLDCIRLLVQHRYVSGRAGGRGGGAGSSSSSSSRASGAASKESDKSNHDNNDDDTNSSSPSGSLLHELLESVSKCSESPHEAVQAALLATLTAIVTSPKCAVHENSMLLALRSTFHVYLVAAPTAAVRPAAKRALLDMLRAVFFRMEAHEAVVVVVAAGDSERERPTKNNNENETTQQQQQQQQQQPFASQYHADAYYLFRSLCKLSSKELPADTTDEQSGGGAPRLFSSMIPTDPTELHSKILSLELILAVLQDYGGTASVGNSGKFLYLVQHYLCVSLLRNCVSNHTQVAFLSQKIFLVLVSKFKGHLKQDIEVFMSNVFFRVLESQNSSFKQKALVLESLRSLCRDPVLLTQIFLNYDCDFDAMNLYKDTVHMLTKLGGKATYPQQQQSKKGAEQDLELSLAAMECLVTILQAFLRALGLPAGNSSDDSSESAGARIRGMLQLDSALAGALPTSSDSADAAAEVESVLSEDASAAAAATLETPVAGSDAAHRIVDAFDRKRTAEQNFELGAVKFTLSLKGGLNFFIDNGFVERDARQVALFFLAHKNKLDKTQMGEALGREPDAAFVKDKDVVEADKGGPGFWVRILHHYVDALDFTGLEFDDAIRLFLSGFRLPGEAQKIDRIMEKFAERYTSLNPSVFPSSDTAFILAFSVIMLNTDLHNPSIKPERRMTVESFLRNNQGIGENGSDLPEEVLRGIFERIKQRPFSLKEDDAARERAGAQKQIFDTSLFFEGSSTLFGTSAEERKRENFKKERDEMMAATEQLIRRRPEKNSKGESSSSSRLTETIPPADVVKPMFDVTWGPMLGILSQVLECSDDDRSVAVCLNGFVYAVRLAAHSRMSLARDTFVSSLAKFTFLGSLKEMKRKNVESIRTLLSVAVIDGEFLGESWGPVLQCMSQLAKLRLTASGLDSDESFLMVESPKKSPTKDSSSGSFFRQSQTANELARDAEENNGKAVLEAVQEVLIDKVFSSTVNLSAKSLAHFVEQLIAVASSEIGGSFKKSGKSGVDGAIQEISMSGHGASIFSLQRLVDVADYNMDVRPRLVWAQVWELMSDFFVNLACHNNQMVSIFAIDSLKQLSLKFLEKPELSEFNFQCSFLKPFHVVMESKGIREDIRELVLHCIDNIIRTKSHNLRSGWKVLFSILTTAAGDPSEKIEYLGLSILQHLLDEHLDDIGSLADRDVAEITSDNLSSLDKRNRNANADDFVTLCRASLSFAQLEESGDSLRPFGLTMRAFCHTAIYGDLIASQRVLPPVSGAQWTDPTGQGYTYAGLSEDESLKMALWRPLFEGLAEGIRSTAKTSRSGVGCLVQRGSILALRAILLRHGHLFSTPELTAVLSETILPAIQAAAESDQSPVVDITSEIPALSNIDFLVDPLPLPPDNDDPAFQQFREMSAATAKRPIGPAELMLEASFTDLRHDGDGDLRKAHLLAKKTDHVTVTEQPFPDSWLATTAPIALGLLTDIATEFVIYREKEGQTKLWPLIANQFKLWCVGRNQQNGSADTEQWSPCEALVRIACRELYRLPRRAFLDTEFRELETSDQQTWASLVLSLFSELLAQSVKFEDSARRILLELKEKTSFDKKEREDADSDGDLDYEIVQTQFGRGRLVNRKRKDRYAGGVEIAVNVVELDFGTLFQPLPDVKSGRATVGQEDVNSIPSEVEVPDAYWVHIVPALKIRCIAAHCLQQSLASVIDDVSPLATKDDLSTLLGHLNFSQNIAYEMTKDDDVSTAFQEALLKDWGEGIRMPDEATEASARLSLMHGSAIFFLSQQASATKAAIHLLSPLYLSEDDAEDSWSGAWNKVEFAEAPLVGTMKDVLNKFLESEEKDGHLVDPIFWRKPAGSGGKVALYCTIFASTVVDILKIIRGMRPDQFAKHKQAFFPAICALVRVESDEIRYVVQEILAVQIAPFVGVTVPIPQKRKASIAPKE